MDDATARLDPDTAVRLERLRGLARLMDTRWRLPLVPVRFGLDSVIGLVPVVGDTVSWAVAGWIVAEARKLGAPPDVVGRMVANNVFDWTIGLVPVVGDLLDVGMRANTRNVALLADALGGDAEAKRPRRRSSPPA
ncbi:MAG: DUF4112 domain-containing protein [Alphaproteobacteria bacterium]|jgi:hypothetical protein|nr:DUF4112 domain-containing protein [Alphaproteobacteria bacterium]